MITSILCLVLGVSVVLFAGMPLAYYLWCGNNNKTAGAAEFWAVSIFAGVCALCAFIKIMVMFGVPTARYMWILYGVLAVLFICFMVRSRKDLKQKGYFRDMYTIAGMAATLLCGSFTYILYGAKFYKGYAWWDIYYYSAQTEAVTRIPFSAWDTLQYEQAWLIGVKHFIKGAHRISVGALGSVPASLAGTDGASVMGFLNALALLMIFTALMYVTENMFRRGIKRVFACFAATFLPGIIVAQLECFLPIVFFMAFTIFFAKCFSDCLQNVDIKRIIVLVIVVSSAITFFLDGVYVMAGLMFIGLVYSVHSHGSITFKSVVTKLLVLLSIMVGVIVLNTQYMPYIWEELQLKLTREGLNGLYSFAYSQQTFDWIFYGSFVDSLNIAGTLLRFIAVILFVAGICGLVFNAVKKHDCICINFLAVIAVGLLFYSQIGEHQYVFFKVFHLSFAPLVIGIFLFVKYILDEFPATKLFKVYRYIITAGVICIFGFCICCSFLKMLSVFPAFQKFQGRNVGYSFALDDESRDIFERIENTDKPIMLVCNQRMSDLRLFWALYYGRNKDVYVMSEGQINHFILGTGKSLDGAEYFEPPADCEIIDVDLTDGEKENKDYAYFLEMKSASGNIIADTQYYYSESADEYNLYVYAKEEKELNINMTIAGSAGQTVNVDGTDISLAEGENVINKKITAKAGITKISLKSDAPFMVWACSVD